MVHVALRALQTAWIDLYLAKLDRFLITALAGLTDLCQDRALRLKTKAVAAMDLSRATIRDWVSMKLL